MNSGITARFEKLLNTEVVPEIRDEGKGYSMGMNPNSRAQLKRMTSKRAKELGFGKWMKGKTLSQETKGKISLVNKGGNKTSFKKGQHYNPSGEFKVGHPSSNKGKGTKTKETSLIRHSLPYRNWRKSVFNRDNFTCIVCNQKGGELNADHIKPFALFPELRFDINNGRTLCRKCHVKTTSFGRPRMKREEFLWT